MTFLSVLIKVERMITVVGTEKDISQHFVEILGGPAEESSAHLGTSKLPEASLRTVRSKSRPVVPLLAYCSLECNPGHFELTPVAVTPGAPTRHQ